MSWSSTIHGSGWVIHETNRVVSHPRIQDSFVASEVAPIAGSVSAQFDAKMLAPRSASERGFLGDELGVLYEVSPFMAGETRCGATLLHGSQWSAPRVRADVVRDRHSFGTPGSATWSMAQRRLGGTGAR
jgi:hypothetical protein